MTDKCISSLSVAIQHNPLVRVTAYLLMPITTITRIKIVETVLYVMFKTKNITFRQTWNIVSNLPHFTNSFVCNALEGRIGICNQINQL